MPSLHCLLSSRNKLTRCVTQSGVFLFRVSWYHSSVTGVQAENLLKNEGKHGSYLIRQSQTVGGSYCLSVR